MEYSRYFVISPDDVPAVLSVGEAGPEGLAGMRVRVAAANPLSPPRGVPEAAVYERLRGLAFVSAASLATTAAACRPYRRPGTARERH